jgi:hypothetical protein
MDINDGKQLFDSKMEAERVAQKMSRAHSEAFSVYKVGSKWAIGGVHIKPTPKNSKVKSLEDIRILLQDFVESEDEASVDDYITEIQNESQGKESSTQGESDDWVLKNVELKMGREIGMSQTNSKTYLVLSLEKAVERLTVKMGGNFSRHIPLIRRQAESLKGRAVIWHTWNNKTSNWAGNDWFYRIEEKQAITESEQ